MPRAVAPDMRSRGYILLISHMRSHSSLLAHILGSHPEIDGYSELHRRYDSRMDLREMTRRIEEATGRLRRGRYALDKLLHNAGHIDAAILRRDDVEVVFLIRNPVDTIPSIVRTSRAVDLSLPEAAPEAAINYYVTRLERLGQYSELLGERAAFRPEDDHPSVGESGADVRRCFQKLSIGTGGASHRTTSYARLLRVIFTHFLDEDRYGVHDVLRPVAVLRNRLLTSSSLLGYGVSNSSFF